MPVTSHDIPIINNASPLLLLLSLTEAPKNDNADYRIDCVTLDIWNNKIEILSNDRSELNSIH